MTHEIKLEIMAEEHATKQPFERRYALYCQEGMSYGSDLGCETEGRSGWMGDSADYPRIREAGIQHPHAVLIRFYPDFGRTQPAEEFLAELRHQDESRI